MKFLVLGLTLLASLNASAQYKAADLKGTYTVQGVGFPYVATFKLFNLSGLPVVSFTEELEGKLNCKGMYSVSYGTQVDITMYCGDISFNEVYQKFMSGVEPDFTQVVDLKGVTPEQLNSRFVAPVKSSLYDNVELSFEFVKSK